MPAEAYTYALERATAEKHRIRRYGFHGTSHKFVSEAAAVYLDRPLSELKQVVFHLGNGASVTAVDGGRSVDTSMGFTPLEGLVMGTRTGDIDPAILLHLQRRAGLTTNEIDDLLNKRSGLVGLAGANDMRDLTARSRAGDADAQLAIDVYTHRLRAYAGAYLAQLGGADVISFTAGVGENVAHIRAAALRGLEFAGVEIDAERNENAKRGEITRISSDGSRVAVLVVPTDEEVEIARQALAAAGE
jgi:acetate kinase